MKHIVLLLCAGLNVLLSSAQDLGPGKKHNVTQDFAWGLSIPIVEQENEIQTWGSNDFIYGIGYRNKVAPFLGLGGSFNTRWMQYKIRQHEDKFYPDTLIWDKQRINIFSFHFTFYTRWFLMQNSNSEGLYMDLGVASDLFLYRDNFFLDRDADAKRTRERGLQYMRFGSFGGLFKIGYDDFSVFANYRLSDLFKLNNGSQYAEVARFSLGICWSPTVKSDD